MSYCPPTHITICLPSGRALDVGDRDLAVCPGCKSGLVEPTRWEKAGPDNWRISLRCPNCLGSSEGLFSGTCAGRFDEQLDEANMQMVADLRSLEQENMRCDCERFIAALAAGAIVPEDFEGGSR